MKQNNIKKVRNQIAEIRRKNDFSRLISDL